MSHGLINQETGRLVVAVTVLSLALSPLWVVTARRLQAVAVAGRESAGEVLGIIYGREAKAVSNSFGEARSWTTLSMRRASYYSRRYRKKINVAIKTAEARVKKKLEKKKPPKQDEAKDA
jgi:hypothetical protein